MPIPTEAKGQSKASDQLRPLDDRELEEVGGGVDIIFETGNVNRDSWFVSFVTKQMVQNSIRGYLKSPGQRIPEVINVGDRRFRVRQAGETFYVEAL